MMVEYVPNYDRPLTIEVDARPAYEFLLTLCVASDAAGRATYEVGRGWFDDVRAHASPGLLAAVEEFCGGSDKIWAHLLSLAHDTPAPRDVPAFLAHLESTDAEEVRLRLLGYYLRYVRRATPPAVVAAAATGDPRAQREFLATSYPADAAWQAALRALLPLAPQETKARLLDILRRWQRDIFAAREPGVLPILRRDAEAKDALLRTASPDRLLETAMPGFAYVPEPGIRRVALIPSVVIRPQIHSLDHHEVKIFCYPVADESMAATADAPPARLVRTLKALADERRLRILKRLTTGDYTLQELATHFDSGNTTMLHHLVILRAAGLVRVGGPAKRYSVQRAALPTVAEALDAYLDDGRP